MADRPPLLDIDYTAAVEAAQDVLRDPGIWDLDDAAAALVDAVWPILHAAAYADGRTSVLDGAEVVYGFWNYRNPWTPDASAQMIPVSADDAASLKGNPRHVYRAWRTPWVPADGERS